MPRNRRRSAVGNTSPKIIGPEELLLPLPEDVARAYPIPGPTVIPIDQIRGNGTLSHADPVPDVDAQPDLLDELNDAHLGSEDPAPQPPTFLDDFEVALQYVRSLRWRHYGGAEELTPGLLVMLLAEMREQRLLLLQVLNEKREIV